MVKATLVLANGTTVSVDGSVDEVQRLLKMYGESPQSVRRRPRGAAKKRAKAEDRDQRQGADTPDLAAIVNLVKTSEEAEMIEERVLDRTSQVDRTLLPLYVVHEEIDNAFGLTSGEISKITTDLGIPIRTANASSTLSRTASRYVIGDTVRQRGKAVRYKLSRRGLQYMKAVISGRAHEEER